MVKREEDLYLVDENNDLEIPAIKNLKFYYAGREYTYNSFPAQIIGEDAKFNIPFNLQIAITNTQNKEDILREIVAIYLVGKEDFKNKVNSL